MHINHKVATCCYCGKKAALVLKGRDRHELACSGCGAPLHDLKMIRSPEPARSKAVERSAPAPFLKHPRGKPKKKRRPAFSRRLIGKIFDEIEDVFDDIFD